MEDKDFDGLTASLEQARAWAKDRSAGGVRVHVPEVVDAAAIRSRSGLSQAAFAARIGVSPATLRNWEQKRRKPEGPARVLLALLAAEPDVVARILA